MNKRRTSGAPLRILFLTQWFEPEPALKGLAFAAGLRSRGHHVEVATAFPNYPSGKIYPGYKVRLYQKEEMDGIIIHRLPIWPSHDESSFNRCLNYISFYISSLIFGLFRGGKFDVVYVYHPPLTPAFAAALFCRLHRTPFVLDIQDLWPDTVAASGMANSRIIKCLEGMCRYVYEGATMIAPQSDGILLKLAARGVPRQKMRRIYNWSTYCPATPRTQEYEDPSEPEGLVNFVYGGNLGQAQGLSSLIESFVMANSAAPNIRLHLYGSGMEKARLAEKIALEASHCVILHGPVPRDVMDRIFDAADVLVLQLRAHPLFDITIPSKIQHYLSCGKPVVAAISGEAASILRDSQAAIVVPPGSVQELADAIVRLSRMGVAERKAMGERGQRYYQDNLGFSRAIDHTIELIEDTYERARQINGYELISGNDE